MRRQIDSALVAVAVTILWVTLAAPSVGFSQNPPMPDRPKPNMPPPAATPAEQPPSIETGLTLAELEEMAVNNNPTLAQAAAEIRAATARRLQSGLYPNPTVGYQGEQIRARNQRGGEQGFFVSQDLVLGGKLGLNRRVREKKKKQAEWEAENQKRRVLNGVRLAYYRALGSQEMVDVRHELGKSR